VEHAVWLLAQGTRVPMKVRRRRVLKFLGGLAISFPLFFSS
jgi:hypothetical protein